MTKHGFLSLTPISLCVASLVVLIALTPAGKAINETAAAAPAEDAAEKSAPDPLCR